MAQAIPGSRETSGSGAIGLRPWAASRMRARSGRSTRADSSSRQASLICTPHSDLTLLSDGNAESKVRQGVTVDVIGESTSVAPRDGLPEARGTWTDFTGYWRTLQQKGTSMNVISEVSFQQIRLAVMGYATGPATPAQRDRMK